jgi:uncharacterized protein (TIGR03435 family)
MKRVSLLLMVGMAVTLSAQTPRPAFEVASVKKQLDPAPVQPPPEPPTVFYRRNATAAQLIRFAFDLHATQLIGGPEWMKTFGFEINAKPAGPVSEHTMRLMVRTLLEDRFKLVTHREQREMLSGRLVLANRDGDLGPNLKKCDPEDPPKQQTFGMSATVRVTYLKCDPMTAVASGAAALLGFPVVDETHLDGLWTVELRYEPQSMSAQQVTLRLTAPPIREALQEQLGLRVDSTRGPVPVLVVDSIEQPTEN